MVSDKSRKKIPWPLPWAASPDTLGEYNLDVAYTEYFPPSS